MKPGFSNSGGYTLIELMMVVAIIGVLVSIALPAYNIFTAKGQVAEGFELASGIKGLIADYYIQTGNWPTNGDGGIPAATSISGKYVSAVSVSTIDGATVVTMRSRNVADALQGRILTFSPVVSGGSLATTYWRCTSNIPNRYLPTSACTGM